MIRETIAMSVLATDFSSCSIQCYFPFLSMKFLPLHTWKQSMAVKNVLFWLVYKDNH